MRILVFGSTGMLGHKMLERLRLHFSDVVGVCRDNGLDAVDLAKVDRLICSIHPQVVVNCVGIVKQREQKPLESFMVNSSFPQLLQGVCLRLGAYLIHFSTDCVFSGARGQYTEADKSDAEDLYGRSKYLGEVLAENTLTLRTSIVGREKHNHYGLLEWFLRQRGEIPGYTRAIFSGVTTNWLSDAVARLIGPQYWGLYHVAATPISKFDLLRLFQKVYDRKDIRIVPLAQPICDRSLCGNKFKLITGLEPPCWEDALVEQRKQDKGSGYAF